MTGCKTHPSPNPSNHPPPDGSRRTRRDRNLFHELGARASEPWFVRRSTCKVGAFGHVLWQTGGAFEGARVMRIWELNRGWLERDPPGHRFRL